MITERLPIIHPGEILKLDFLEPMNINWIVLHRTRVSILGDNAVEIIDRLSSFCIVVPIGQ
jgi:plasmid maintenance system antidote protein VapI